MRFSISFFCVSLLYRLGPKDEGDGSRRDSKMLAKGRHGRDKLREEIT